MEPRSPANNSLQRARRRRSAQALRILLHALAAPDYSLYDSNRSPPRSKAAVYSVAEIPPPACESTERPHRRDHSDKIEFRIPDSPARRNSSSFVTTQSPPPHP